MVPGYLHFDLRRGLKADMLAAAISPFISSPEAIRAVFDELDLGEISWERVFDASGGLKGSILQFFVNNALVPSAMKDSHRAKKPKAKILPAWDHAHISPKPAPEFSWRAKNPTIQACLMGEVKLEQLKEPFMHPRANLEIAGIALEILGLLECKVFVEPKLAGPDALWILCHLVMLAAQLSVLDPKFLSASKICLGPSRLVSPKLKTLELNDETWLRHILCGIPAVEVDEPIEADVLAAAFIKTLVGQFGPRGDSTILAVGIGLSPSTTAWTEVLWCEASLPDTMNEVGTTNKARSSYLFEVCGQVGATTDMASLLAMMSLHGAKALSYHLVHGERHSTAYLVRFLVHHERQKEALEAFLIKGGAHHVALKPVESHQLNKRLVTVPMGTGNKTCAYRFFEYIYYEQCVRVEPLPEDLELYVQKTDYSVDVARSDLLMAWKKWRGQAITEIP